MVSFVTVNGATLAYEISGPEDGPLMITLHGGRGMGKAFMVLEETQAHFTRIGDHRSDYKVYSRLNDRLRVVSFDYRGHGQSSRTKPYTFKQLVDDIEGVRQHFVGPDEKFIIRGGSFGGFLAQQYAITYPSRLSHLILRGTAASHHHEEGAIKTLEGRISKVPSFSKEMLRDKVFGAFEDDTEFRLVHFATMPLYREDYDANGGLKGCRDTVYVAESHNDLYSQEEKYFDYTEKLGTIEAKTLVIVGDQDWICPPASCRIGTTVATNALLTGNGEKFAFATTKGFKDVCVIGDQSRPELFNLSIRKASVLHSSVIEIDERITIDDYDLNPHPLNQDRIHEDPDLVKTPSGEIIRILKRPDEESIRKQLEALRSNGYTSLAVCFMHAYIFPDHEKAVERIARDVGFEFVTISSDTSPAINFLNRSNSTCSEAYLYPIIRRYVDNFQSGFKVPPRRVEFMCSDGGLKQADRFRGNEALLSGPAGGVVGIARCFDSDDGTAVIGFDMGGTSTDVSRYDGKYDFLQQTSIAGRTINLSMLNIATVAAGGGSILFARNGLLTVGPESAGAHPGPACYRKGGPLTVTDANLFLGRLVLSSFPAIFGESGDQELDTEIVTRKFKEITAEFNHQTSQSLTPEEVASGFLNIANETMSRPIRNATEARGYAPENHNLVSFGGAGGQHACSIADKLGIKRILIHKLSSLLSAHGIAHAELQYETFEPFAAKLNEGAMAGVNELLDKLKKRVTEELVSQKASEDSLVFDEALVLKYFGTDTNLSISKPADGDYAAAFTQMHLPEFAFSMTRPIIIESVKVRGTGSTGAPDLEKTAHQELVSSKQTPYSSHKSTQKVYLDGVWTETGVFKLEDILEGSIISGPAIIIDKTQTILVESLFKAYVLTNYVVLEKASAMKEKSTELPTTQATTSKDNLDPIQLSVFAHRFMAIAEQMGNTLQRTSISSSIKERLDFSCAIFSPGGKLVANAPHIPIHLGSMQFAVQAQHRHWLGKLKPGDVLLTNHPSWGGTHLPDLTVVTPVFVGDEIAFYVASRGHHTDIGGMGITSMMPESRSLWEEGIIVPTMKI
ncbi:hypothetical protein FALBO_17081, partial [Fusarium albosuccineum]